MEKTSKTLSRVLLATIGALFAAGSFSCNKFPVDSPPGTLSWRIDAPVSTRALHEIPDTDAFILKVSDASGKTLYEGAYGASPEALLVDPGTYTVRVVSAEFQAPAFDAPQFGDEQAVLVSSGARTVVRLNCTQRNAGLRLLPDASFRSAYPDGRFQLSSFSRKLDYDFTERRIAYFIPGNVSVSVVSGGASTPLLTRFLSPCEILSLGLSCPAGGTAPSHQMTIAVDTSRVWNADRFTVGEEGGTASGASPSCAYGISQAREHAGEKAVWVCGFIVGGDLSSSKNGISFEAPFQSATNLALAARSSVTDKASCLSVKLVKGEIRDRINLADHPEMLGRKVFLKGDLIEAYYGIPGLQNITECIINE